MVRLSFEVLPGQLMSYELTTPANYDRDVSTPFVVSISGLDQTHVNGFSRRLPSDRWVLAVPQRPQGAPLMFEGTGVQGDGVWYLREFCWHLSEQYCVELDRFLMVGVSNGGNSVLRFGTLWPELCRGLVVVTCGLSPKASELQRLRGVPIDMYVGNKDECGFYAPMIELEGNLRAIGHTPPAMLTVFDGAGHCCSPLVDQHLVVSKMRIMLLHSGSAGMSLRLNAPEPGTLSSDGILSQLCSFCKALGIEFELLPQGGIKARLLENQPLNVMPNEASGMPNVSVIRPRGNIPSEPVSTPTQQQHAIANVNPQPMLPIKASRRGDVASTTSMVCKSPMSCGSLNARVLPRPPQLAGSPTISTQASSLQTPTAARSPFCLGSAGRGTPTKSPSSYGCGGTPTKSPPSASPMKLWAHTPRSPLAATPCSNAADMYARKGGGGGGGGGSSPQFHFEQFPPRPRTRAAGTVLMGGA